MTHRHPEPLHRDAARHREPDASRHGDAAGTRTCGGTAGIGSRPGFLTYGLLARLHHRQRLPAVVVVRRGERHATPTRGETLPLLPGGNFLANAAKVFDTVPFWLALRQQRSSSPAIITISVVTFSTLAGYAFAKLRFAGRNGLMIFVIATMAIPTQLGIIPLFMLMRELGWTGDDRRGHRADARHRVRRVLHAPVPRRRHPRRADRGRADGRREPVPHVPARRRCPAARPAMAILGLFTFMTAWTDFLWPLIVLSPQQPDPADGAQPAAVRLLRRLLDRARRRGARDNSAARALRRRRASS